MLGRRMQAACPRLLVLLVLLSAVSEGARTVNVTIPDDLLGPPGDGNFAPRLLLAVEVRADVINDEVDFAKNTNSALGSYLYSRFPETFTLADGALCSRCVQVGAPVPGLQELLAGTEPDFVPTEQGHAPFIYTIWLPNNIDEGSYFAVKETFQAQSLDTLFAASNYTDQLVQILKILDSNELQEFFTIEDLMLDDLAAASRLNKVASLTRQKIFDSSNATGVTLVASNDNHSNDMGKQVTVALSRNNLTSVGGFRIAFGSSSEILEQAPFSIVYPEDVEDVSEPPSCTGAPANASTACKSGQGVITTTAYWFSSSREFAAVTEGTSGLDNLREQLEAGNQTRKLASGHPGEVQSLLNLPEVSVVSGVLELRATYGHNYLSVNVEYWLPARLGIPIQADTFQAGMLTSCVRLDQATTHLGLEATYLPSYTVQPNASEVPDTVTCRADTPGKYLVVQLNVSLDDAPSPIPDLPPGTLPPAQQVELLFSQALELGKDIIPPEFSKVFSFIAMVDERLLDGQIYRTLADLASDIQRSLAEFLSRDSLLGEVFRDLGPCYACFEVVDMASQGSIPNFDLLGVLVPSAASITYRVHLPFEVPGLDVQDIARTQILRLPLESLLGSSPAQQMVLFFQQAYDSAENSVQGLADYLGRRYSQVESQLRSAYRVGEALVEMAESYDIGTTLQTKYGSIDAAFSRISALAELASPNILFQVTPANNSTDIITAGVQINTPNITEWCIKVGYQECERRGLLETLVVYYQDVGQLELSRDMIMNALSLGPAPLLDAIPLSGVLDVQSVLKDSANNQTTLLCNFGEEGCSLSLQIPVDKSQWDPAAVVQCIRLEGGFLQGLQSLFGPAPSTGFSSFISVLDAFFGPSPSTGSSSPSPSTGFSGPSAGFHAPDTVNCLTDATGMHMLVGLIPERPGPPLELALTVFPLMLPGGFDLGLPFYNGSLSDGLPAANGSFINKLYETAPSLMMALGLLDSNGTRMPCRECIQVPSTGQVPSPLEATDVLMRVLPDPNSFASAEDLYAMLWEQRSSILGSNGSRFGEVAYIFPPMQGLGNLTDAGNLTYELPKFVVNMTLTLEVPDPGDLVPPAGEVPDPGDLVPPEGEVPDPGDLVPPDIGGGLPNLGRRSLRVAHGHLDLPDLGMDVSEIRDRINQALMPALGAAVNQSTSNLGNPLEQLEITADFNSVPGEMYQAEVLVTVPSPFLIQDKLDAFMFVLETETQGGLSISSTITLKVSSMSGEFIPPLPPQFPLFPPGQVPPGLFPPGQIPPGLGFPPPFPPQSTCERCGACVSRVYREVVTLTLEFAPSIGMNQLPPLLMPPNIPQEVRALVLERLCPGTRNEESCQEVFSEIKPLEVLRAAALCNHLEQCSPEDECQIPSQAAGGEVADMDFCTTDGTVSGADFSQKSVELDGDNSCFTDDDCSNEDSFQFCDKEGNTTIKTYCNEQGFEVVKLQGECATECRLPQVVRLIEQSQAITNCTSDQECPEGESCQESGSNCRVYSCNEETGEITTEPCGQICLPTANGTTLGSAYFEDSGGTIHVNLSTAAAEVSLPCTVLFGEEATEKLGSAAECMTAVDGQELWIELSGDASIRPNDTLSLRENQRTLRAANGGAPFSGSTGPIQNCSNCAQPEAVISGPSTLKPACEGTEFEGATISGVENSSPAGRAFEDVSWELVRAPFTFQPSNSEDSMTRILEEASQEDRLVITMGKDTLESMPASDQPYTLRLSVKSFLGTTHSTMHSIMRENSTGTPTVTITTPSRVKLTQGIVLDAEASRSAVCSKAEYKWSCEGHTMAGSSSPGNCTLLEQAPFQRSPTREISMDDLLQQEVQPGDKLTFRLVSRYVDQPGSESVTEKEVVMLGAGLQARLDGPSGTVAYEPPSLQPNSSEPSSFLVFDASGSTDPLASDGSRMDMEFLFSCTRADEEGGYCFDPPSYRPAQEGPTDPTWRIDPSKFVPVGGPWPPLLITVVVSKPGRTATASNVLLLRIGEVVDVSIIRFCGGRQTSCPSTHNPTEPLSLAANVEVPQGIDLPAASYSWSFTDEQAAELGMQLNENNTASGITSYAVIVRPEAIPRTGFLAVQCNVSFPSGASGVGVIRVPLHRPPVCTSASGCLEVLGGEDGQNKTFPSVDFPASASGFSSPDEDETLSYEFGYKVGDEFEASGSATSSNKHTFLATKGPGTYTPYVCAIDSRGARTCSESSFTLNSNSSISESVVQELLDDIDFASLQDVGDDDAIFDGVSRLGAQLKGVQGSNNSEIGSNEVLAALQILNDTLNAEGKDIKTAATAIRRQYDISEFTTRSTESTNKGAEATISALNLVEKGQSESANPLSPNLASKALGNLGNIGGPSDGPPVPGRKLQAVTDEEKTNLDRVNYAIKIIGRELEDQVSPGSTLVSDGGNIAMAAIRDSYQTLSGTTFDFSPSASNGARAGVFFQQGLADWCSQTAGCNLQDRVTAVLAYVSEHSVYTAAAENWPNIEAKLDSAIQGEQGTDYGAISNIEAISGALGIEVGGENSGPLCDGPSCAMSVTIPVDMGMYNDSRELACARLSPPEGVSSSSDLPLDIVITSTSGNLGVTGGTVTCDTTHLGTHFIVQYDLALADLVGDGNAPPPSPPSNPTEEVDVAPLPPIPASTGDGGASPPPPSTKEVSPPPPPTEDDGNASPPPPSTEPAPDRRSGANSIAITSTLDVSYENVTESLESEQEFKNDVTRTVAENLRDINGNLMTLENGELCYECVRVVDLRQGSVVVDIEVDLPDSIDDETLNNFAENVDQADAQVFANSRFEDKVTSLSAEGSGALHLLAGPATAIMASLIMALGFLL